MWQQPLKKEPTIYYTKNQTDTLRNIIIANFQFVYDELQKNLSKSFCDLL